jgi:hypothetical protein
MPLGASCCSLGSPTPLRDLGWPQSPAVRQACVAEMHTYVY